MYSMFGIMDVLFPIMFVAVFGLIVGTIVSTLVKGHRQNRKNDASPRLSSQATVVTKRTHVWGDHSRTTYFATFQFESGDRLELEIPRTGSVIWWRATTASSIFRAPGSWTLSGSKIVHGNTL